MSWDDDDGIGYGKPPRWTQFPKGQSGNPKGRPRRKAPKPKAAPVQSDHDDILRRALEKEVEITQGGKKRTVSMKEVIVQRLVTDAGNGKLLAIRDANRLARELEQRDRERAEEEAQIDEKVFVQVQKHRAQRERVWQIAAAEGREPAQPWPHPDDIIIDEDLHRWTIRGPSKPADVPFFEAIRADREVHQMRLIVELSRDCPRQWMIDFNVSVFAQYDHMLPKRWQLDVDKWEEQAAFFLGFPTELIEKALSSVERRAASMVRPALSAQTQREMYQSTNAALRPILRRMGYRSLKQFETAYSQLGAAIPWPRDTPRN